MAEAKVVIKKQWFVNSQVGNIKDDYEFYEELGSGAYGSVYKAKHKELGEIRAIKTIPKNRIKDYESFKNEIEILKTLDHPNIIKVYETYETDRLCYLVTELCEGGELFYHIVKNRRLTEGQCSRILKQIMSAIMYCHMNNICHRDIKPENFLLKHKGDDSNIKLIDFGLSKQLSEDEIMHAPNGTPYYIAPEIMTGNYTKLVDNWSLGVLLYIMISGSPPFYGPTNTHILRAVQKGVYSLELKAFKTVSDDVKDLIKKLLVKDPKKRLTSEEAYNHPWIQRQVASDHDTTELNSDVFDSMMSFLDTQKLKRAALTLIASQIPETEIDSLRQTFIKMDANGDGTLTMEELKDGLHQISTVTGKDIKEGDLETLMGAMDANNNGCLDYTEFLAVCMQSYSYLKEANLKAAFRYFDRDGNGKITTEEIQSILGGDDINIALTEGEIHNMIKECDVDGDGAIDYAEFMRMMQKKDMV